MCGLIGCRALTVHRVRYWLNPAVQLDPMDRFLLRGASMTPEGGRWVVSRVPQRDFHLLLLAFAAIAALRLIGVF